MTRANQHLGAFGERMAAAYLKKKGYEILQNNFRCRLGEIDIIAIHRNTYVFVEVKTRRSLDFGRPVEAISEKKKRHMLNTAQSYLSMKRLLDTNFRFDAIEVFIEQERVKNIEHLENIIE
ncbi:MAG: YraN family protein [Thermotaleaceae bacterium]